MLYRFLILTIVLCLPAVLSAAPKAPEPPKKYDVQIRYEINAYGNTRLVQYFDMMRAFKKAGFVRDPDEKVSPVEPADPKATLMRGTVPAAGVDAIIRQRHVKRLVLLPAGEKLPAKEDELVRVAVRLTSLGGGKRQQLLHQQTQTVLESLGFLPAIGYENQAFTRLLGALPAGKVKNLLDDLRATQAGKKQGSPFQTFSPIRASFVFPNKELIPSSWPKRQLAPDGEEKIGPGLRALVGNAAEARKNIVMEVILVNPPRVEGRRWVTAVQRVTTGVRVEDRMGRFIRVYGPASEARELVKIPEVVGVRLPRRSLNLHRPPPGEAGSDPVKGVGLDRMHRKGHKGRKTHIAVVDVDFRGWKDLVGKGLPENTTLLDLTAQRNRDLLPDPYPAAGPAPGAGTRCALTVTRAAPEARLVLLRVDDRTPAMIMTALRALQGERYKAPALINREDEMELDRKELRRRGDALNQRRIDILSSFRDDAKGRAERAQYEADQKKFDQDYEQYTNRVSRYVSLVQALRDLRNVEVVTSSLVWPDGYPVDGGSPLSGYITNQPLRALWVQAAGHTRGQAWSGLFRDSNDNEVMEFASPSTRLPGDNWTRELNFLAWEKGGRRILELPAGARLRISFQWREVHDRAFHRAGEDPYQLPLVRWNPGSRKPARGEKFPEAQLHGFQVVLLRQVDPEGKTRPADDLDFVAESVGAPVRLRHTPSSGTYEQVLEVRILRAGRYALRIEGQAPRGMRPADASTLPSQEMANEMRPRLFVRTLQGDGRAVLRDYVTEEGSLGIPADARGVVTVGAVNQKGTRQPYSAGGPPHNLRLLTKPDVLAYDQQQGTPQASSLTAGVLAVLSRSAGTPLRRWFRKFPVRGGKLLRVPNHPPLPKR